MLMVTLAPALQFACAPRPTAPQRFPTLTPTQRAAQSEVDHEAYEKLGYRLTWRAFPSLGRGQGVGLFSLADDRVIVQDTANTITLIDATTGRNRWSATIASPLTRFLGNVLRMHMAARLDAQVESLRWTGEQARYLYHYARKRRAELMRSYFDTTIAKPPG